MPILILRRFCPAHLLEEIEGDLLQKFEQDVKEFGARKARRRLLWNVIRFFRPGILLRNKIKHATPMLLFQNNLRMAFRTIQKNKLFSAINIFGLSVSMAACLLIFQFTLYELSFDRQFSKSIYRIGTITFQNGVAHISSTYSPSTVATAIKEKFPEVAEVARISSTSSWFDCALAHAKDESVRVFNENRGFYFADQTFISFFDVAFLKGEKTSALSKPFSIVLSETSAKKYFDDEDPMGQTVTLRGSFQTHDYTVTGVMKDFPNNSHLAPEILASWGSYEDTEAVIYAQLNSPFDMKSIESKFNSLAAELTPKSNGQETKFVLEPLADIHLYSKLADQFKSKGNPTAIYFLMAVAIAILFIAWINYVNLTTARSAARAKEVGIRKANGASRGEIIYQFLTETLMVNVLSLIVAVVIVLAIAPTFYAWIGVSFTWGEIPLTALPAKTIFTVLIFLMGITVSGLIPSQFISRLNPTKVLKGRWMMQRSGFTFRQVAVIFQFTTAFVLATSILVFQKQFNFMRSQDLGIDIKHSIVLQAPTFVDSTYLKRLAGFKNQLQSLSIVRSIATSADVPGNFIGSDWSGDVRKEKDGAAVSFGVNVIDPDYITQFGLTLLAGRDFEGSDFPLAHFGDKIESVILNRKAIELLDFAKPEDAIDKMILWGENRCRIVGVVEDYHQRSVKEPVIPMLLVANMGPSMTLKLTAGADQNIPHALMQIRQAWNHHFPANAFDYYFLEDHFNKQYAEDERVAKLFNFFCLLALTVSCMGLFALSLHSAQQRTREISIRKILGAPVTHLIKLLSQEYLLLLVIALLFALPLAYWGITGWLNTFALRIKPEPLTFVIPVAAVTILALITVSSQALKAIRANPTETLKHE